MALEAAGGDRAPWPMVSLSRAMELQTAKEILAEVFHARPGEVELMIQRRLEGRI